VPEASNPKELPDTTSPPPGLCLPPEEIPNQTLPHFAEALGHDPTGTSLQ
jgi:hypothetical protein